MKKVSICTISYNQYEYIKSCLDSVSFSRKLADSSLVEHIVVDAISGDGTLKFLRSCDSIDRLIVERDDGPSDGLNKAFLLASGEYGFFINADDCILPGAVKTIQSAIKKHPNADVILMGGWIINERGHPLRIVAPTAVSINGLLTSREVMFQPGMIFKLNIFKRIGGFNRANKSCWDLELLTDMMYHGANIVVVPQRIGCFRLHGSSLSGGGAGEKHLKNYQHDLERLRKKYAVSEQTGPGGAYISSLKRYSRSMMKAVFYPLYLLKVEITWRADNRRI